MRSRLGIFFTARSLWKYPIDVFAMDDSLKNDAFVFHRYGQPDAIITEAYLELVSIAFHLLDIA
jgi:hypothetical protein